MLVNDYTGLATKIFDIQIKQSVFEAEELSKIFGEYESVTYDYYDKSMSIHINSLQQPKLTRDNIEFLRGCGFKMIYVGTDDYKYKSYNLEESYEETEA